MRNTQLYNEFLSMLADVDSNHHSCLNDLVLLKDYNRIVTVKVRTEDIIDVVNIRYKGIYEHQLKAERMKQYLEQNVIDYYAINNWELFIELRNGDKFVYDSFNNTVSFNRYDDELTEEQEINEFTKNLKKYMTRNFINQEELADRIGTNRMTVSRYMNGKNLPDYITLRKIARVLQCSVDDLFYKKY